ncbi:MAG TPA: hypothetical protein VED01_22385 [Burkholderiales bacterium]|nr:hypothetical protein [Burkholderiales bacterium]
MVDLIEPAIVEFANFLLRYFVALAAVGALAMALMELWKKIRHSEMRYHAESVAAWFKAAGADVSMPIPAEQREASVQPAAKAFEDLIQLSIGASSTDSKNAAARLWAKGRITCGPLGVPQDSAYALFALPLERMVAHMQTAADAALNNPEAHAALFAFMTSGAHEQDVHGWPAALGAGAAVDREELVRRADMYSRLQQATRHKLVGFQIYTERRWVNWNQRWANIVGAAVLGGALLWVQQSLPEAERLNLVALVVLSLLGGMLSPVAKDIVVALRKVRGG